MIKPINVNIVFGLSNCLVTSLSNSYTLTSSLALLELAELDFPADDEVELPALDEEAAFAVKPTVTKFALALDPSI